MIESSWKDVRYGVRMLVKHPGFSILAALSLALGIGVNSTIFSVVNAVLFRPLPVEDPARLVDIYTGRIDGYPYGASSYPDFRDLRDQSDAFVGLVSYQTTMLNLSRGEGPAKLIFREAVTGDYFELLGVDAAVGRTFLAEEDAEADPRPVAVLGHRFWQREFGGDPDVVGKTLRLNGRTVTVVGVAPEEFTGTFPLFAPDLWTPMAMQTVLSPAGPDPEYLERRGSRDLWIKGRLTPRMTAQQAEAELRTIMTRLREEYPDTNQGRLINVLAGSRDIGPRPATTALLARGGRHRQTHPVRGRRRPRVSRCGCGE